MDKAKEYLEGSTVDGSSGELYFWRKFHLWASFWRGHGFPQVPDMRGQRVLDVGCGHGSFVIRAALGGARVTGIDIAPAKFAVGIEVARGFLPYECGSVRFLDTDASVVRFPLLFDMIISHETFEHVDDLPALLSNLYDQLIPGGSFFVTWGGMWPSVFGGHYWLQKSIFGIPIPWSHRIFTRPSNRPGVNQLAYKDYVRIINDSPFEVARWRENVGSNWGYNVFRFLARVPGLRDAFTQNIYAELRREQ